VPFQAIVDYYRGGSETLLDEYSSRARARVCKATRFSWWFTTLMHRFSEETFAYEMQLAELEYIAVSPAAAAVFAENYVGLKF
jgi:p-hydroxybenzoate 3-monooxygenase